MLNRATGSFNTSSASKPKAVATAILASASVFPLSITAFTIVLRGDTTMLLGSPRGAFIVPTNAWFVSISVPPYTITGATE